MKRAKTIFGIALLLATIDAFAAGTVGQGTVTSYIRMQPTSLPSSCRAGDMRFSVSANSLMVCTPANTWGAVGSVTGGFANPMTTQGDLIAGGASGAPGRLAAGTSGFVLTSNGAGTLPTWQASSSNYPTLTNGQLPIGSTGNPPVAASLTGTANQITVTGGVGTITLSTPQSIATSSSPTFAGLTVGSATGYAKLTSGVLSSGFPAFSEITGNLGISQLPTAVTWPSTGTVFSGTPTQYSVISSSATGVANMIAPSSTTGWVLTSNGTSAYPTFQAATGGFTNPMTTVGDIIYGGASGAATRLAAGTLNYVLTSGGPGVAPSWAASAAGFTNPMTTGGDLIYGGASGVGTRLANGTSGQVLTSAGGTAAPTWSAATPLTTKGDLLGYSTVPARLGVGPDNQTAFADSSATTGLSYQFPTGKNYLTNPAFESNTTTGWALGAVTLTSNLPTGVPTFGSGASGNLSLAASATTPLAGTYSMNEVSSAATTAGNFVASNAIAIDLSDQAKVFQFKFSYKASSGTTNVNWSGTTSNSYGVAIYDVTNSAWIIPSGVFSMVQSSGSGVAAGMFQTTSNSTSYRLVMYNANATAGAATIQLDDFYLGPQAAPVSGTIITEWAPYTMTIGATTTAPTKGTTTTDAAWWRRVGDSVQIKWDYVQTTAGSTGTGNYRFALPSGLAIDTTKVATTSTQLGFISLGYGFVFNGTNNNYVGVYADTSSTTTFGLQSIEPAPAGIISSTNETLANTTMRYSVNATIPIAGWGGTAIMSSDGDGRVIAATAVLTSSYAAGSNAVVKFDTVLSDTTGSYSTSTGLYTIPVSGRYRMSFVGFAGSTVSNLTVAINGTQSYYVATTPSAGFGSGSLTLNLKAGDTVAIFSASAATFSAISGGIYQNTFSIERLAGAAVIASTESVNGRYFSSVTTVTASDTTMTFATKSRDTHNAYASGTLTIPVSGMYQFNAALAITETTGTNSISIYQNGVQVSQVKSVPSSSGNIPVIVSDAMPCVAGDLITIRANSSGATPSITSSNVQNFFSWARVGN